MAADARALSSRLGSYDIEFSDDESSMDTDRTATAAAMANALQAAKGGSGYGGRDRDSSPKKATGLYRGYTFPYD